MRRHVARWFGLFAVSLVGSADLHAQATPPPPLRVELFVQPGCGHCAAIEHDLIPALEERFGPRVGFVRRNIDQPEAYRRLVDLEVALSVPITERAVPAVVVGGRHLAGEEALRRDLGRAIEDALEGGEPSSPPHAAKVPGDEQGRTPVGPPIRALYFHETGCQQCSRAELDIRYVQARFPTLAVRRLNVYDHMPLAIWLTERAGRSEFHTPAVFIADEALLGPEELHAAALEVLVERYAQVGASAPDADYDAGGATAELVERFRGFGIAAVAAAGLIDGVNPCAFATLIFFISYLTLSGRRGGQILAVGAAFAAGLFVAYTGVGFGLYRVLDLLGGALTVAGRWVMGATAVVCVVLAMLSFRDAARARRGQLKEMALNLPDALRRRINAVVRRGHRARFYVVAAFLTGLVVSLLELACTGQIYLPTIMFVSSLPELRARAVAYLLLYNFMFIVPLIVVFVLAYFGTTSQQLTRALKAHAAGVKVAMGVLFAALALWLAWAAAPEAAHAEPPRSAVATFTLPAVPDGPTQQPFALADHLGRRPVLLVFWDSMCSHCHRALPFLERLHQRHHRRGLRVVAVSVDPAFRLNRVGPVAVALGVRFPVVHDVGGRVADRFRVRSTPTWVAISRRGRISFRIEGFDSDRSRQLESRVMGLLR